MREILSAAPAKHISRWCMCVHSLGHWSTPVWLKPSLSMSILRPLDNREKIIELFRMMDGLLDYYNIRQNLKSKGDFIHLSSSLNT